ncbi:Putative zinc-finger [Thermosyntropha lipolytica DSM 11003]|uniref:Anti-sigma-W factor RsiW n=1 Tax=Thermosyntropha lipolytica DSM 11003 TaxID=1123382 RepID=A0A1M5L7W5_9FIRM|nr:zf-HC2 domain-containing protein [Thermosyntropha lipolytica]SHG60493.1 Putative zinc-finger [Thermosyntropha lipolytica DSM 11003]
MNCKEVNELLLDYVEGNLPPYLKNELKTHLENCIRCQKILALTELENSLLKDTSDIPELDEEFTRQVMKKIALLPAPLPQRAVIKKFISTLAALAACLLVAFMLHYAPWTPDKENNIKDVRMAMDPKGTAYLSKADSLKSQEGAKYFHEDTSSKISAPAPKEGEAFSAASTGDNSTVYSGGKEEVKMSSAKSGQKINPENYSVITDIKIAGLPADYVLQTSRQIDENRVQYVYTNHNQNTITIEISLPYAEDKMAAKNFMSADTLQEKSSQTISLTDVKSLEDKAYKVTITADLPAEELNQLLSSIELVKN